MAVKRLYELCTLLDKKVVLSTIIPKLTKIKNDDSVFVKATFAGILLHLYPLIGKKHTKKHIVGIFLELLNDKNS